MAFGRGSITVAMTSIASSLGKRVTVLRNDRDQSFFLTNVLDDRENLFRHFLDRPHAVNQVVDPTVLVILHQWICFFFICPEPLANQVLAVIGAMKERPPANVADTVDFGSPAEGVVDLAASRAYPPSRQSIRQGIGIRSNLDHEELVALPD